MMRLISGALHVVVAASYGTCAALIVLGLLTLIVSLFTGNTSAQIGGLAVVVIALANATLTATALHCHRRSTR